MLFARRQPSAKLFMTYRQNLCVCSLCLSPQFACYFLLSCDGQRTRVFTIKIDKFNPIQSRGRGWRKRPGWLWTFIAYSLFGQNTANLWDFIYTIKKFKIYLEIIWYDRLLCRELRKRHFDRSVFSKFAIISFLMQLFSSF